MSKDTMGNLGYHWGQFNSKMGLYKDLIWEKVLLVKPGRFSSAGRYQVVSGEEL